MKTLVMYHADCLDGFGAAYAAWKALGEEDTEYRPIQYGQDVPCIMAEVVGSTIYFVDFCPSKEVLQVCCQSAAKVVVIDHHKTAIDMLQAWPTAEWPSNLEVSYRLEHSGAVLTWQYFVARELVPREVPWLLLRVEDRDLWRFDFGATKAICEALQLVSVYPRTFKTWDGLVVGWDVWAREELTQVGKILATKQAVEIELLKKQAYPCSIDYASSEQVIIVIYGVACNAPQYLASELGNALVQSGADYAAVWTYLGDDSYKVSLRSTGDFDVSVIAKYFGGGGHNNAAGFVVKGAGNFNSIIEDISDEWKD